MVCLLKAVSAGKGPLIFIFSFFNLTTDGLIILFSIDRSLFSLLCGFRPNIAILGFFLNNLK